MACRLSVIATQAAHRDGVKDGQYFLNRVHKIGADAAAVVTLMLAPGMPSAPLIVNPT